MIGCKLIAHTIVFSLNTCLSLSESRAIEESKKEKEIIQILMIKNKFDVFQNGQLVSKDEKKKKRMLSQNRKKEHLPSIRI